MVGYLANGQNRYTSIPVLKLISVSRSPFKGTGAVRHGTGEFYQLARFLKVSRKG